MVVSHQVAPRTCEARTRKGKQCRRRAVSGRTLCVVHLHIPPEPGLWERVVHAAKPISDLAGVVGAIEFLVKLIELIVRNWPHHLMLVNVYGRKNEYERLLLLTGVGRQEERGDHHDEVRDDTDWLKARMSYVLAHQLLKDRAPGLEDLWLFEDFDEWFWKVSDEIPDLDELLEPYAEALTRVTHATVEAAYPDDDGGQKMMME